jgi:type II secretory pathway pseudopilin PulG
MCEAAGMDATEKKEKSFPFGCVIIPLVIIILLAALLIPALNKARESARRAKCLSNLKQIGLALKQYALDNKEVFPWEDNSSLYCASFGKVYPAYANNLDIFRCPSSNDRKMRNRLESRDNEAFTANECARSLSYAYCHNQGYPWTEETRSTTRLAGDKYATQDYSVEPRSSHKPVNHYFSYKQEEKTIINIGRNVCRIDGSAQWDNSEKPLEADFEWDIKAGMSVGNPEYKHLDDSHPESDQTGTDWWSDPPDKP